MQYGGGPVSADNRALLAAIFDGLAEGDGRAFVEAMAEDFTWTMIGSTDWSGVYHGKAAVRGELLRPLMAVQILPQRRPKLHRRGRPGGGPVHRLRRDGRGPAL